MSRVELTKEDAKEAWSWKAKKGTKSHVEPWVHVASTPCRILLQLDQCDSSPLHANPDA